MLKRVRVEGRKIEYIFKKYIGGGFVYIDYFNYYVRLRKIS